MTRKTQGAYEPKESTSCKFSAVCLCIKFCLSFWSSCILVSCLFPPQNDYNVEGGGGGKGGGGGEGGV